MATLAALTRVNELEMGLSVKENLLCHSRYIRDVLAPVIAREGGRLNEQQMAALRTIFASLSTVKITTELLQYSRIEKALGIIAVEGSVWPVDATLFAEALLSTWENSIGPLRNIRADLWGPGGRLEGTRRLMNLGGEPESHEVQPSKPVPGLSRTDKVKAKRVCVVSGVCGRSVQGL